MGLVSLVVPDDQLMATALEAANDIAANCSPTGMAHAKRMLWNIEPLPTRPRPTTAPP